MEVVPESKRRKPKPSKQSRSLQRAASGRYRPGVIRVDEDEAFALPRPVGSRWPAHSVLLPWWD
jgi:hypothetical protein